ncbi:mitochondrial carrier protein [Nitzschia inconspicua]|uniref:Mitochondrial carrier protein n=1 Tax=Nitzschia inconspicua TaxID=303405 RepID=A0A9K3KT90_9STRA|nr:mitochondrial carrier protein [Nitzschia inconspicua]
MAAAASAATTAATTSPLVHAIGGSIGSALALLLFYPLERARIELQSQASAINLPTVLETVEDGNTDAPSQSGTLVVDQSSSDELRTTAEDDNNDDASVSSWMSLEEQQKKQRQEERPETQQMEIVSTGTTEETATSLTVNTNLQLVKKRRQQLFAYWYRKSKVMQVLLELKRQGELYKGMTPIISTIFTSQFIFFFLHAYVKRLLHSIATKRGITSSSAILSLISSCMAGIGNVLITNPLWVTNMAIVTGETKSQNLLREMVNLYKTRGMTHLWGGTSASILLVSNPIIQFFCYEQLKQARLKYHATTTTTATLSSLGAMEAFVIAALAKGIATISTYPLQLAQTLLRIGSNPDDDHEQHHVQHQQYKGTVDCLLQLYKTNKNIAAWFTGMRAKLLQTVLTAAFTFLTYEQILGAVQAVAVMQKAKRIAQTQ